MRGGAPLLTHLFKIGVGHGDGLSLSKCPNYLVLGLTKKKAPRTQARCLVLVRGLRAATAAAGVAGSFVGSRPPPALSPGRFIA